MFTNLEDHGGNFRNILETEFSNAQNVQIASGYASLDLIQDFSGRFRNIASQGGNAKLLLGMAFYEGLGKKKLDAVNKLHSELNSINKNSGVYVTNGRRYHGKVYRFYDEHSSKIYVGSSNFSFNGTRGNIECTVPVVDKTQRTQVVHFLNDLYSNYSIPIDHAEIMVPGKENAFSKKVEQAWESIQTYDTTAIDRHSLPYFDLNLEHVVKKEKSNLNAYFGKGRLNTKTGKIAPRPWYEIEIIANKDINSLEI